MNSQQLVHFFKISTKTKFFAIFKHFCHLIFVVLALLCVIVHADLNIKSLIFFAYPFIGLATAIYAFVFLSRSFMKGAYSAIKAKSLNYQFLLVFSAISSFLVSTILWIIYGNDLITSSYYSAHQGTAVFTFYEAVTLIFYFAYIGGIVEQLITKQTNLEINKIQKLQPTSVRIKNQDQFLVKNINALKIDDVILVLKGETIPADGILLSEKAFLQAKLITGDASASEYTKTSKLFAGMINYGNEILVQAKALSSKSFISTLIYRLENVEKPREGVFSLINKYINKIFTFELILALIFLVIWTVIAIFKADHGKGFNNNIFTYYFIHKAIFSTLSLFTAICPCALGMTIPLIFLLTSLKGQRKNIIFCNLNFFNKYKKIKTVAFDKTGTISTTELKISNLTSKDLPRYLKILISLEERSNHPIAQSLVNNNKNITRVKINNVKELVGAGIEGLFQEQRILVASRKYILFHFPNLKNLNFYPQQQLLIVNNEVVLGFDLMHDYDPKTIKLIKTLQKQNYKTLLLTGDQHLDHNHPLKRIFQKDHIFYNLTPEDKVKILNKIRNEDKVKILYIGDGLNDVNVFQEGCDIAIALGNAHVAIKSISDLVFIDNDLSNLSFLWKLANRNQWFVKFCFFWFLIYNLAVFFISGFALISPSLGSGLMMMSCFVLLLVVLIYRFWRIK